MLWRGQRESTNVEDRRGMGGGGLAIGGGVGVLGLILALLFGVDPGSIFNDSQQQPQQAPTQYSSRSNASQPDEMKQFVSVVLADTEDVWTDQFRRMGRSYTDPKLVLFSGRQNSACGMASSAVGPFYCPGDEKVYIDLSFFQELRTRFHAPGDFAEAYVIAHEVGHHVQKLLGTSDKYDQLRGRLSEGQANQLSVRMELQADFYAGIWAKYAEQKGIVEPGDIEEALRAASAVGDDRLQKQAQGYVVPDSFTHGTAEQRSRWFRKGYETGDIRQGDTFNTSSL